MTRSISFRSVDQSRFLVIGYGDERRGDDAVGPRVANRVANWHLPSLKSISTHQLTPELIDDIALTDYVIFVEACSGSSCARTVQLDPIVVGGHSSQSLTAQDADTYHPLTLLSLTQQRYNRNPQAWCLQVPVACVDLEGDLSSTAQRGCDQALRTIEQFLRTYQQPAWMEPSLYRQSA